MGFPICENLLAAGYRLTVYDVAREPVERLARKGALACQSHSDLVRASDVVFTMLPSDAVLVALVGGEDGLARTMRRGQTLIDMSTVSPLRSEQVALMLADSGCAYLRCPVSGSTANAAAATLAIFCSGDRAAYDAHKPVLDHIGSRTSYCGAAEEARVLKLLVNIIVGVTPALVGEALAFGLQSGLERGAILDAIGASVAASPVIGYKLDMLKRSDWTAMATIDIVAKDLDLALEWGRSKGVPMPFTTLAQQTNSAYQGSGQGQLDFFATTTWPYRMMDCPKS